MTDISYILAQHGTQIELVEGGYLGWEEGEAFLRKPALQNEWWVVIKVFVGEEHDQLAALVKLMGFDKVETIFAATVLENHTIQPAFQGDAFEMETP